MAAKQEQKKIQPKKVETVDIEAVAARAKHLSDKLERDMKKFIPVQNEISDLKKQLVEYGNANLADEEIKEIRTPDGPVKIGARNTAREITDMDKAIDMLGLETAMKLLKISLGDLDKYLTPEQVAEVTRKVLTDNRRITL
jgi:DNA repair protein RadC